MMSGHVDRALQFDVDDATLVAIVTAPTVERFAAPHATGVLIVVGGPQYRVGSHRQFVLLARALADAGFAVMRFDHAGAGDSSGTPTAFTSRDQDIRAAIDAFFAATPAIRDIAIWGLCDAASAALMYAPTDRRVSHLMLLNPWVRSDEGLARTQLRHYYRARLFDPTLWRKLVAGRLDLRRSLRELLSAARTAGRRTKVVEDEPYQVRMARGWTGFAGGILLIRSGDDLTAREFTDHASRDAAWKGLLQQPRVACRELVEADHTFSRQAWRDRVAEWTVEWLLARQAPRPEPARSRIHEAA